MWWLGTQLVVVLGVWVQSKYCFNQFRVTRCAVVCCSFVFVCLCVFFGRRCVDGGCRLVFMEDVGWSAVFRVFTFVFYFWFRVLFIVVFQGLGSVCRQVIEVGKGYFLIRSFVFESLDGEFLGCCCRFQVSFGGLAEFGFWVVVVRFLVYYGVLFCGLVFFMFLVNVRV